MEYKVNNSNLLEAVDTVELPAGKVSGRVRVTFADGERARVATDADAPIVLRGVEYRALAWFKRDESGAWSLWNDAELWRAGSEQRLGTGQFEPGSRANRELVAGVFAEVLAQEATPRALALGEYTAAEAEYSEAVGKYNEARKAYEQASEARADALVRTRVARDALAMVERNSE